MEFIEQTNFPTNKIRTELLVMVNKELSALKKTNKTKINSKKITEAENYYSSLNNYVVKLQEEKFIPNSITSDVIQNKNVKYNFSFKSPDQLTNYFIRKIRYSNNNNPIINSIDSLDMKEIDFPEDEASKKVNFKMDLIGKRSDISTKKNENFRKKTLKLDHQLLVNEQTNSAFKKNCEHANSRYDKNIFQNSKQKGIKFNKFKNSNLKNSSVIESKLRTESGYSYLKKLAKNLKLINKKPKINFDFEEMKKAINEKDSNKSSQKISTLSNKNNKINAKLDSENSIENKNNSFDLYRNKKHTEYQEKSEFNYKLTKFKYEESAPAANKNLIKMKSEEVINNHGFYKRSSLLNSKPKNHFERENNTIIKLNECSNSKFQLDHENEENDYSVKFKMLNKKYFEEPKIQSIKNSFSVSSSCLLNESSYSKSNEFENTHSFKYVSISNSSNIIIINAAESFKSVNGTYSFKIKLNKMDEDQIINQQENNNNNNDSDYFKENNKFDIEKKQTNKENEHADKNYYFTEAINEKKLNKLSDSNKFKGEKEIVIKGSSHSRKNKNKNKLNFSKAIYQNDSDSDIRKNEGPLSERTDGNRDLSNTKFHKMTEINFLNSVEIRKANSKIKKDSEKASNKKQNYLHSTDTSSFIQLQKIKNEEFSNSKEKVNQSKIINLLSNESGDDEIDNFNLKNKVSNEEEENNNDDFLEENRLCAEDVIQLKRIPRDYNCNENINKIQDAIEASKVSAKKKDLEVLKLLRCKNTEQTVCKKNKFKYEVDSFGKSASANINEKTKITNIRNHCEAENKPFDKFKDFYELNKNHKASENNIQGFRFHDSLSKALGVSAKMKLINIENKCETKLKKNKPINRLNKQENRFNDKINCYETSQENNIDNLEENFNNKTKPFKRFSLDIKNKIKKEVKNIPKQANCNLSFRRLSECNDFESASFQRNNASNNSNYNHSNSEQLNITDFEIELHECSPNNKFGGLKKKKKENIYEINY